MHKNSVLSDELVLELVGRYHTPLYVFEEAVIRSQCQKLKAALSYPKTTIRYACKALTLAAVLKIIKDEGLKIDASSLNEVKRAMLAGFQASDILYTGENCSELVFTELVKLGCKINCSSLDQLRMLGKISSGAAVSIRFNPGEGHGANNKTNTGGPSSKHGIYFDQIDIVREILSDYELRLVGIHTHIGSGTDIDHWLRIKDLTFQIAKKFEGLEFIDLGGGLPVVYDSENDKELDLALWGKNLSESFATFTKEYGKELELVIEPGRYLVAECGSLLAEVQNLKTTPSYNFAVVNSGFNHNPRPAMYGSYHPIRFVYKNPTENEFEYVIAGYLCESGDVFTVASDGELKPRKFRELSIGDIMVMGNIGAYSHSMKSEYNSMNLPASVLIESSGNIRVIERRGTLEDLMRREVEVY